MRQLRGCRIALSSPPWVTFASSLCAQPCHSSAAVPPLPPTPPCLTLCCPHPPCARLPQPGERAGSLRNPKLSTSWEKKMKAKAEEQAFKDAKRAALTARKEAAAEEKRRREEAKVRAGAWHAGVGGTAVGWAAISKQCVRRHGCRMPIGCAAASRACRLPCPSILLAVSPATQAKKEAKRAAAAVTTRVSSATAKRMMKNKKQRKLLRTGDA